jgi:hypothetical protein
VRGIAIIDWQPGAQTAAVWVTRRRGLEVGHVNAVDVDFTTETDAEETIHTLTRCSGVLLTQGSTLPSNFIDGAPLSVDDLSDLVVETEALQTAVLEAIAQYKRRTRTTAMTDPIFEAAPEANAFLGDDSDAAARAFGTANYLQRLWAQWLRTDEERRKRTVQPRTGVTPWVMPAELNADTVADFPSRFADRVVIQPVV